MAIEAGRLLVVDDNEMNRDMLSRRLARQGHEVEVAEDGSAALERISRRVPDMVLLDIMMPGMDGFEVLRRIRAEHGPGDLPVIMATAKDDSADIVSALKAGANDYVTKPFDFPVVLARVTTQLALKRSRDQLSAAHARMRKDLDAAARIQQHFLPRPEIEIEGLRSVWRYLPCDELAGDMLSVVRLDEHRVGLAVMDVSGHGVPSALLSVTLSRTMGSQPGGSSALWTIDPVSGDRRIATPTEVASDLVKRFPRDEQTRQYFTMAYAVLDLERLRLHYVVAGHPEPVLVRSGADSRVLENTGPPIGLLPPFVPVRFREGSAEIQPGDRLYLFSDGIPEAENELEEEFGSDRLLSLLTDQATESLEASVDAVVATVREWCGSPGPADDISILGVEIGSGTDQSQH